MSELLQDVQFRDEDDLDTTKQKLRILQDEVTRLSRIVAQFTIGETGVLDFGQVALNDSAQPGIYAVPNLAAGFFEITVNGQPGRLAVYLP